MTLPPMSHDAKGEGGGEVFRQTNVEPQCADAQERPSVRLTVDEHPSLGLQISIESDQHGFRIKGPKYAGTSRRLLTAELDDHARREIAGYIGYGDLLALAHAIRAAAESAGTTMRGPLARMAEAAIAKAEGRS